MRQYGREDVDYETWYSGWMKRLAKSHTRAELEAMLNGAQAKASSAAASHLRAVERTSSMTSNSAARAHARNSTAAAGEAAIAIDGALEIHELFPEHAKRICFCLQCDGNAGTCCMDCGTGERRVCDCTPYPAA